jgi:hypothetical protein
MPIVWAASFTKRGTGSGHSCHCDLSLGELPETAVVTSHAH